MCMNRTAIFGTVGLGLAAMVSAAAAQVLESGFVTSGGESIYYEDVGEGEPVVFCHGLGGNHAIWYQQVPVFAQHYRVITWDQRGFGRSTNDDGESSPKAAVADLLALFDHLEIERAHLIGQSMGGWAVLGFSLEHPERVRSLVLADTIGGIYTEAIENHFDEYIRQVVSGPPVDQMPIVRHPALGEGLASDDPAQAFLYRQIGSLAPPAPANMGMLLRQTAYEPKRLRALNINTLFVVGSNDPIFPPPVIREAATQLTDATVIEIPETGHSPYFERAAVWNRVVFDHLRKFDDQEEGE